jgi:hypothetical protein
MSPPWAKAALPMAMESANIDDAERSAVLFMIFPFD